MEGFSSTFCLSDKASVGVMALVQPMGVILTVDCLAINFVFFISWSLLSFSYLGAFGLLGSNLWQWVRKMRFLQVREYSERKCINRTDTIVLASVAYKSDILENIGGMNEPYEQVSLGAKITKILQNNILFSMNPPETICEWNILWKISQCLEFSDLNTLTADTSGCQLKQNNLVKTNRLSAII